MSFVYSRLFFFSFVSPPPPSNLTSQDLVSHWHSLLRGSLMLWPRACVRACVSPPAAPSASPSVTEPFAPPFGFESRVPLPLRISDIGDTIRAFKEEEGYSWEFFRKFYSKSIYDSAYSRSYVKASRRVEISGSRLYADVSQRAIQRPHVPGSTAAEDDLCDLWKPKQKPLT